MRAVVQRVKSAEVTVEGQVIGKIGKGFMVLLGISNSDSEEDIKYIRDKIINLRVFEDDNQKLNLSLKDVDGELLIVSQFTLYGDCRKGRRPNFMEALSGAEAEKLYEIFVAQCRTEVARVETGKFGADMDVSIVNNGPVTILLDSKKNF